MSNLGQAAGAVAGATVGFFVGGPTGAAYGFNIGMGVGSLVFPTQLPRQFGPRLEDLNTTSAKVGEPVIIPYGTIAVPGTAMFLGCTTESTHTEEVGGKGAPEGEVVTYLYNQTIAMGLGEGPIAGVLRIWENGELKYDGRPQQEGETDVDFAERLEASARYGETFTLHLGTESQLRDPTLEALIGAENLPAFRGLAYIVYPERELREDQGRRHPLFRFELGANPVTVEVPNGYLLGAGLDGRVQLWATYRTETTDDPTLLVQFETFRNAVSVASAGPQLVETSAIGYAMAYDTAATFNSLLLFRIDVVEDTSIPFRNIRQDFATVTHEQVAEFNPGDYVPTWTGYTFGSIYRDEADDMLMFDMTITLPGDTEQHFFKIDPADGSVIWHAVIPDIDPVVYRKGHAANQRITGGLCYHMTVTAGHPQVAVINTTDGSYTLHRMDSTAVAGGLTGFEGAWAGDTAGQRMIVGYRAGDSGRRVFDLSNLPTITPIAPVGLPTDIAETQVDNLVVDWAGGFYYELDLTSSPGFSAGEGLRKFRISDNTEVAQLNVQDMGLGPNTWETGVFGFVLSGGAIWITYLQSGNYMRLAQINADTMTMVGTWAMNDGIEDPGGGYGAAWFDNVGLRTQFTLVTAEPAPVSIADIIRDVAGRCGMDIATQIDVADLEDRYVLGYALPRTMSGRDAIEPLRTVGYFDGAECGQQLKFPVRGKPLVATLAESDMGCHDYGDDPPPLVTTRKGQDPELPRQLRLRHISAAREYEPGEQRSPMRYVTRAVNDLPIDLAVAITPEAAAQAAETNWAAMWAGRWTHEVTLDLDYIELDPADCIGVPINGRVYRCRIEAIEDTGALRRLSLRRDDDGSYVSYALADEPQRPPSVLVLYGLVDMVLLDLPALRDEDDDAGIYGVAYRRDSASTFRGATFQRSIDSGATYQMVGAVSTEAVVGTLAAPLPAGPSEIFDSVTELYVDLLVGELVSRTQEAVLNGANALAIGAHGRWNIVQFLNAEQTGLRNYRLTGLVQGRRGTEHYIGTNLPGDTVVLISGGGLARIPLQNAQIGMEFLYRVVASGTSINDSDEVPFTGAGLALETFSPVHIEGEWQPNGDLVISWIRRGRISQELRDGADIPLSEETEAYEVDITGPGSPTGIIRTLASSTQSVTYTAAQAAADGYYPGSPVPVRVYQLSAIVGRGTPGEATL